MNTHDEFLNLVNDLNSNNIQQSEELNSLDEDTLSIATPKQLDYVP